MGRDSAECVPWTGNRFRQPRSAGELHDDAEQSLPVLKVQKLQQQDDSSANQTWSGRRRQPRTTSTEAQASRLSSASVSCLPTPANSRYRMSPVNESWRITAIRSIGTVVFPSSSR